MEKPPFTEFDIFKYPNCIHDRNYFLDYQIHNSNSQIGVGIHGIVYLGFCLTTQEHVVIKFMKPYYRTARNLELHKTKIKHPKIANLKNYYLNYVFRPDSYFKEYWLISVQEYIDGNDLFAELVEKNKSANPTPELYRERELFIRNIVRQLLEIVIDLAKIGLIHSDIKVENVIYNPDTKDISLIDTEYLTEIGHNHVCGTYEYFSWEMVRNGLNRARKENKLINITPTSDLWSIGVLAYFGVIHKFPFNINRTQQKPNFRNIIIFNYVLSNSFSKELKDFLHRIFVRQSLRISLEEALNHPWLNLTKKLEDLPPPLIPFRKRVYYPD